MAYGHDKDADAEAGDDAAKERLVPGELTREMLRSGRLVEILARSAPGTRILTDAERAESLRATMRARPTADSDLWLFAYGSLIWNPTVAVAERRTAHIVGWHRAFCLLARAGRGTGQAPGLLLGLRAGGSCSGLALRIDPADAEADLDLLWRREMIAASYVPQWLPLQDDTGVVFAHGLAFTMDPCGHGYAGDLTEAETVHRLATARGELGSCADYLFRTEAGLRAQGIVDATIERLARLVSEALAARPAE